MSRWDLPEPVGWKWKVQTEIGIGQGDEEEVDKKSY